MALKLSFEEFKEIEQRRSLGDLDHLVDVLRDHFTHEKQPSAPKKAAAKDGGKQ